FKGNALLALGGGEDVADIFIRQEAFRDCREKKERRHQDDGRDREHCQAMSQHYSQAALIEVQSGIEDGFGLTIKPSVTLSFRMMQEAAAQHRRKRERDEAGD